jgi:colanic acid biosynthesis glycosyl transferase WcaI
MRLLVITNLFHPDRGGGASVFSDLCFGLVERGHQVTVLTTHPYYPEWRRKSGAGPWRITRETIRGVIVRRYGLYIPAHPSRLVPRVLYELSFAASLLRALHAPREFDAVMVFCPMLGAVLFAGLRKLLHREPLWLNVQDIPADAAAASGISRSRLFDWLGTTAQRVLFNRADVWSSISPVMVERLQSLRRRGQPVHLCPNWLNGSMAEQVAAVPSKLGRPPGRPVRLLYAGNIGKKQGLVEVLKLLAASRLDFRFQIHGNGGEAPAVAAWVKEAGDPRFIFGEFLDEAGFVRALHETDWFVISEKPGVGASFIPSKLIPCIATGTPVLAVCDKAGPLGREATEQGLGLVLEWSETSRLAVLVEEGLHPERFRRWQENCLRHARTYSGPVAIGRFARLLGGVVGR